MIEPHDQQHHEGEHSEGQRADDQPDPGLGAAVAEVPPAPDREDDREEGAERAERDDDARREDDGERPVRVCGFRSSTTVLVVEPG